MKSVMLSLSLALLAPMAMAQEPLVGTYIDTGIIATTPLAPTEIPAGEYVNIGAYPGTTLEPAPLAPAPVITTRPLAAPLAAPQLSTTPTSGDYNHDRFAAFDRNGDGTITTQEALNGLAPL